MNETINRLTNSIQSVIVGKDEVIEKVIISLLCDGHVLIQDVPGVGKTKLISALSSAVNGKFNRIQLTPDIMPSDIVGFSLVNQKTLEFEYKEGVAMCNFLLADEINRASPKAQSSLLEIMEEHQISLDGVTHALPEPFMVLATQNPIETYGTYHLPEAQMDRFFMRISMGYPTAKEELLILERSNKNTSATNNEVQSVVTLQDITNIKQEVLKVEVSESVKKYIVDLANATRNDDNISLGISPRGSIAMYKGCRARAYMLSQGYATPNDVKFLAESIFAHRIILSAKGKTEFENTSQYIKELLNRVSVPM
ncbi:MAG: MoxR family ATPase [Ruminococcus sp.]|nr:MoxR family ATPase [Ruminococcus sp.]